MTGDCREVHTHVCDTCWDEFPCDRECRNTEHWITCPQCEKKETQDDD